MPLPRRISSTNKRERERDENEYQELPASAPIRSASAVDPLITQPPGRSRNVVIPQRLSRDYNSSAIETGPATQAHSLQHAQFRPSLQQSKSQSSPLQAPQQHLPQTRRPPPAHRLDNINTEVHGQPLYKQSNEYQGMPPYSADARYWYPSLISDMDPPVRSNTTDPQVYPQITPMASFEMKGDVPSNAGRVEHSSGAYAHSPGVDNPSYYASIHPHTSVATNDPTALLQHPRHPHSQAQQQRGVLENNAYGVRPGAPTGLG